jgi:hypothetical protein
LRTDREPITTSPVHFPSPASSSTIIADVFLCL